MEEIWKDVAGYEGKYKVSNLGNVISLNYEKTKKEKQLKKSTNYKNGYIFVGLSSNGKMKNFYVHRLVAQAFIPNPNNYRCVNHKDENKTNNCVDNLEWCTHKYNENYGTAIKRRVEKQSKKVLQVETGIIYKSTMDAYRKTGISHGNISNACLGRYKQCNGFHWKYV